MNPEHVLKDNLQSGRMLNFLAVNITSAKAKSVGIRDQQTSIRIGHLWLGS